MKILVSLLFVSVSGVGVVTVLYFYSLRNEDKSNGFNRKTPPHIAADIKEYDLGVNSFYLAGFSRDSLYLGNSTVFNRVFAIDKKLTDTVRYYIEIRKSDTIWGGVRITVDSQSIFLTQSSNPSLRVSSLRDPVVFRKHLRTPDILDMHALSASSIIGRCFDRDSKSSFFFKENLDDSTKNVRRLLQRSEQGVFTDDGMIAWEPHKRFFFYTFFYKNRFLKIDSNLNVLFDGHTIDTFSVPQLSLVYTHDRSRLSFASTPRSVNKFSFASDSLLFVQSAVKANNETVAGFNGSMTIDTYSALSGKYLFSFYLPYVKGLKCKSIGVHDNYVYAIYDRYLVSFKLYLNNYRGVRQ